MLSAFPASKCHKISSASLVNQKVTIVVTVQLRGINELQQIPPNWDWYIRASVIASLILDKNTKIMLFLFWYIFRRNYTSAEKCRKVMWNVLKSLDRWFNQWILVTNLVHSPFSIHNPDAVVRKSSLKQMFLKVLQISNCLIQPYFSFQWRSFNTGWKTALSLFFDR